MNMKGLAGDRPVSRRDFLGKLALGSFWAAIGTAILGMIRLPKPVVFPEVSSRLKLGRPADFPPGTVRRYREKNIFVARDNVGIYAISAVCTHLGCIVTRTAEGKFDCPCHGSKFDGAGRPLAGPAPRALDWVEIYQAPNGLLYADTLKSVPLGTKWKEPA